MEPRNGRRGLRDSEERADPSNAFPRSGTDAAHFPTRDVREAFGFDAPRVPGYLSHFNETPRGRAFGRGPKGYRRSDERIKEEISDRLMASPDVDASEFEVDVKDGIVTLTGTVDYRHEKRIAEYIAEDALGVNDVDNRLTVRHGFWAKLADAHIDVTK